METLKQSGTNTEPSPSNAPSQERPRNPESGEHMRNVDDWRTLRARSWTDQNSTLEAFLKWLTIAGVLLYLMHFGAEQLEKHKGLIVSEIYGCKVPPRLKSDLMPPVAPPIPHDNAELPLWYDQRIKQLHRALQEARADRLELRRLCP